MITFVLDASNEEKPIRIELTKEFFLQVEKSLEEVRKAQKLLNDLHYSSTSLSTVSELLSGLSSLEKAKQ